MWTTITASGGRVAPTFRAAATAVPPEPPMSSPSSRVTRRAVAKLTASLMGMTSSTTDGSYVEGQKSSPMPSTR